MEWSDSDDSEAGDCGEDELLELKDSQNFLPPGASASQFDPELYKTYKVRNSFFEISDRFIPRNLLGKGAFGVVCSAWDRKQSMVVAIKKIENVFHHKQYTKRTLRELKLLRLFKHANILHFYEIMKPPRAKFNDLFVVTEFMETDLGSIIRSTQKLTDAHCQFFIYQVLRGLKFIHSAGIVHRDIKPKNLLVNSNCDLKICDFGLARTTKKFSSPVNMTDYVATRWYRAPEIILKTGVYSEAVDLWAVGCVLGELLVRSPLFPGNDAANQLELVLKLIGTPSGEELSTLPEHSRTMLASAPNYPQINFTSLFPGASPNACDLLSKLLVFNPEKRISATEALKHPYLRHLHRADDEPTCEEVSVKEWFFEHLPLSNENLKDLVFEEIKKDHPDFVSACPENDSNNESNSLKRSLSF